MLVVEAPEVGGGVADRIRDMEDVEAAGAQCFRERFAEGDRVIPTGFGKVLSRNQFLVAVIFFKATLKLKGLKFAEMFSENPLLEAIGKFQTSQRGDEQRASFLNDVGLCEERVSVVEVEAQEKAGVGDDDHS